jgi:hypothetical protein
MAIFKTGDVTRGSVVLPVAAPKPTPKSPEVEEDQEQENVLQQQPGEHRGSDSER